MANEEEAGEPVDLSLYSDDAGPWLAFADAIDRVKAARQCSDNAAEAWLHKRSLPDNPTAEHHPPGGSRCVEV